MQLGIRVLQGAFLLLVLLIAGSMVSAGDLAGINLESDVLKPLGKGLWDIMTMVYTDVLPAMGKAALDTINKLGRLIK